MYRTKWMDIVEVKTKFNRDGKVSYEWKIKYIDEADKQNQVRCAFCKKKVALHQGPNRHWCAAHLDSEDSKKCEGGTKGKTGQDLPPPRPKR